MRTDMRVVRLGRSTCHDMGGPLSAIDTWKGGADQKRPRRGVTILASQNLSREFISHKMLIKWFDKSQCLNKFVNLLFMLEIMKDKLTDLWGS